MPKFVVRLDQHAQIADIAQTVRQVLSRYLWAVVVIVTGVGGWLWLQGDPGALAFLLIGAGSLLVLAVWAHFGQGLPIIPILALQNLIAYGLPIATHNETVVKYPAAEITSAGFEVLLLSIAMILSWRVAMQLIPTGSPLCYALQGFDERSGTVKRLGFTLVVGSTIYEILRSTGLLEVILRLLPSGSDPILHVLMSAASACGFFLAGMMLGRGEATRWQRVIFWSGLAIQAFISAAGFLLSPTIIVVFAATVGLFWGSGKLPWRLLIVVALVASYLNLGKFVMRERYWGDAGVDSAPQFSLTAIPQHYLEWATASFDLLTMNEPAPSSAWSPNRSTDAADSGQSLLERINNLQNLLYVIDAMETAHVKPLDGATYKVIPPLLIPRILWPEKPRTHEGQIMLNVHFGRQDLNATYQTYVAWGLLPEAYGNFGAKAGALVLGVFLGGVFAWTERFLTRKLLLSLEGFLAFSLFLGMANSYEMVASVLVTSIFQGFIPIVLASAPFIDRVLPKR